MARVVHIVGNGDQHVLYSKEPRRGLHLTCNVAPLPVPQHYATCIVDFKFMNAMMRGDVTVPGDWVLGYRPKIWMDKHAGYYMRVAPQVKEFYTDLPKYALRPGDTIGQGYTNWSCGHMAAHYAAKKLEAEQIHLYGFDSIFDFNLRSTSDFILNSDREANHTNRMATNWRPAFMGIFHEFEKTEFILHHIHDSYKIGTPPDNVTTRVYK